MLTDRGAVTAVPGSGALMLSGNWLLAGLVTDSTPHGCPGPLTQRARVTVPRVRVEPFRPGRVTSTVAVPSSWTTGGVPPGPKWGSPRPTSRVETNLSATERGSRCQASSVFCDDCCCHVAAAAASANGQTGGLTPLGFVATTEVVVGAVVARVA